MQNRIRERLREAGIQQKAVAERMGITAIGFNYIAGSEMPKIDTFRRVADAAGLPMWLLMLSDDELRDIRSRSCDNSAREFVCPGCGARITYEPVSPGR